ncbi:MAG: hypothetical protein ACK5QX_00845, partial [bacterium]
MKPGTSISLVKNNQIFNDNDIIKGDYSLSFEAPGGDECPENAALLGNADVVPLNNLNQEIDAELYILDTFYDKGKLLVNSIGLNTYRLSLLFGLTTLSDNIKNLRLRSILSNQSRTIHSSYFIKRVYIKPVGTGPYKLKINDNYLECTNSYSLAFKINTELGPLIGVEAEEIFVGNTLYGITPPYVKVTKLTLNIQEEFFIEPIEETENAKNSWLIEADPETDYHNQINAFINPYLQNNPPDAAIRFPLVFNDRTYGEESPQNNKCSNAYYNGNLVLNSVNWGAQNSRPFEIRNLNTLHPFVRIKYVLDQIASSLNTSFEGDFYTDVTTGKRLIWNAMPAAFAQKFIGSKPYIFFKRTINLSELVPDITVIDFLKALQNRYNLAIYLNEKNGNIVIRYREPIYESSDYLDITDQSSTIQQLEDISVKGI